VTVFHARGRRARSDHDFAQARGIWQVVGGAPIVNRLKPGDRIAATTPESNAMSKALKKRGFTFVGSTICYAFMQATRHGE
jgi:3-methyladenine DNA glycosylase Tag